MKKLLPMLAIALTIAVAAALNTQASPQQRTTVAGQQQNDTQTQEAKAFSGMIVKEKGKLVLMDKVANVSYQLDNQEKARQFEGKQVKVTGKLDLENNLIYVETIELVS